MYRNQDFIRQLVALVAPPHDPTDPEQVGQWENIQGTLGTTLPHDLRELSAKYGSGRLKHPLGAVSIEVFNPFDRRYCRKIAETQRTLRSSHLPFDVFPSSPGLLSWGTDESQRQFCWLTLGDPDTWPVIFITADRNWIQFDTSLSGFLVQLFSGQVGDFGADMRQEWFLQRSKDFIFEPAKPYDASRWPPLWEAVLMLDREKTRQLLDEGADPNRAIVKDTPLFTAIENVCDVALVKMLLAAGADPNVRGEEGRTPLQLAAASDDAAQFIKPLLTAGAEVSPKDNEGWSALLWACTRKNEEGVRLLLAHGADPTDRLPDGRTALNLARRSDAICGMLKAAGASE